MTRAKQTIFLMAFCAVCLNGLSQRGLAVKVNLIDPLAGRYSIGFEKEVAKGLSVAMEVDFLQKDVTLESNPVHPWYPLLMGTKEGFVFEPQLRWYPGGGALKGTYASLAGFIGIAKYRMEGWIENDDWSAVGASCHLGHQLALGRFVLDGFAGGTWADDDYPLPYLESTALFPAPQGLRFSGGLRLGFQVQRSGDQ